MQKARPIVLEPIVNVEITAPEARIGDITGDLVVAPRPGQRHARSERRQPRRCAARRRSPSSPSYQSRLNAMTGGQGRYTLALSHYEAVPPAVQQQLMAQRRGTETE